jgi:hypothetical protein
LRKLEALRARIPAGTVLECVENTYRPQLNGSRRSVTDNRPTFFDYVVLDGPQRGEVGRSAWPTRASEITWLDARTVRWPLGRRGGRLAGHTVTFRLPEEGGDR